MRGSDNFNRATTKIIPPPLPQTINNDHSLIHFYFSCFVFVLGLLSLLCYFRCCRGCCYMNRRHKNLPAKVIFLSVRRPVSCNIFLSSSSGIPAPVSPSASLNSRDSMYPLFWASKIWKADIRSFVVWQEFWRSSSFIFFSFNFLWPEKKWMKSGFLDIFR